MRNVYRRLANICARPPGFTRSAIAQTEDRDEIVVKFPQKCCAFKGRLQGLRQKLCQLLLYEDCPRP